jgi:hypothetical protein
VTTTGTVTATTAAAAETPAAGAAVCLACHQWPAVMQASANYKTEDGIAVNPHTFIDTSDPKPHSTGKGIPDCTNCHKPHPLPPPPAAQIPKGDVEYCFSACHHQRNFTPCSQCH